MYPTWLIISSISAFLQIGETTTLYDHSNSNAVSRHVPVNNGFIETSTAKDPVEEVLRICIFVEDDSYYTSEERLAAAVDLSVSHVNSYILPKSLKIEVRFQSTGPSCSRTQYSATSNAFTLLRSGVTCNVFFGAGMHV
jgi:hypothetical protein